MFRLTKALIYTSLLLNIIILSDGYPDGTGILQSCSSFVPGHGAAPQSPPSPYKISFSPPSYTTGSPVSVIISTCSEPGFKGFLIQARHADRSQNQQDIIGRFGNISNARQTCTENRALAHTESSVKSSLSFAWYPPSSPAGHIVFRATFVRDFSIYWTDVVSDVLLDASLSTPASDTLPATLVDASCSDNTHSTSGNAEVTTSTPASTTDAGNGTSQVKGILKDSDCGVTKGCFSNCRNSVCSFVVSWREEGEYGLYTITADTAFSTSAYVALGFSTDDQMDITVNISIFQLIVDFLARLCSVVCHCFVSGRLTYPVSYRHRENRYQFLRTSRYESIQDYRESRVTSRPGRPADTRLQRGDDSLTGCASRSDGSVVLFNGRNTGRVLPELFTDNNVTLENYTSADAVLSCTFKQLTVASPDGRRVDISKPWVMLFALGLASVSDNGVGLQYHGRANRFASPAPYRVNDIVDSAATNVKSALIRAHGSLMVGAWIFLASIGIVVARYYKPVWTNLLLSQKVWFQIHRTSMILACACTVAGFIIIFVEVKGWSELGDSKEYLKAHPIMGIVVTALTIINPGMALFRPHPEAPRRPIFNWAHWFVGMAAHVLGVITIFFGVQLDRAGVPYYLTYILAAYVAWQIFVMLLLEVITCYGHRSDRKDMYELRAGDGDSSEVNYPLTESSMSALVKRIIFLAHIVIVGGLAVAVIVLISVD